MMRRPAFGIRTRALCLVLLGGIAPFGLLIHRFIERAQIGREMTMFAALSVLSLIGAWFAAEVLFLGPIHAITRAARRIREGDREARSGINHGPFELNELARAFDEMASALLARRAETERAYEEVWESTERFRLFMDNSPVVAFIKDDQSRMVYVNRPFERQLQVRFAGVQGKTDFEWLPEKSARQDIENDRAVLESDQARELIEIVPTPDGVGHTWHVFKFPICDAAGHRFVGGVALDITKRRELEDQLLQAQKMEAVGRLAGGVAHDFNNLPTAIMGYAQLMAARLGPDDPATHDAQEILKASARAAMLTRHLLAFSRRDVVQMQVLDLNLVVADITKMLRRLIGADIELNVIAAAGRLAVKADVGQLEQVIMNLAVNARDAMPQGGRLTIETSLSELSAEMAGGQIPGLDPGPHVLLAVTDTGIGMDRETQARIFEPFFTTKAPDKGTGLGLSTVYGIVQQCGGSIHVYSDIGWGTTFKIYLPLTDAKVMDSGPVESRPEIPHGTETLLIVEDEDAVAAVMRAALEGCGYNVLEARHGAEALALCKSHDGPIHLLLTDIIMPVMMGPELAERFAAMRPEAKVMFTSGYTERGLASFGTLDPQTPYLQKPFGPDVLARKVRDVLNAPQRVAA